MTSNKARAAPGKVKRTVAAAFAAAVRRGDIYMRCPRCKRGVLVARTSARGEFMRCSRRACGYVEVVEENDE